MNDIRQERRNPLPNLRKADGRLQPTIDADRFAESPGDLPLPELYDEIYTDFGIDDEQLAIAATMFNLYMELQKIRVLS